MLSYLTHYFSLFCVLVIFINVKILSFEKRFFDNCVLFSFSNAFFYSLFQDILSSYLCFKRKTTWIRKKKFLISLVESLMIQLNFLLRFSSVLWILFCSFFLFTSESLALFSLPVSGFDFSHVLILIRWIRVWVNKWMNEVVGYCD